MGAARGCLFSILALDALGGVGAVLIAEIIATLAALALSGEFNPRPPWIGRQHIPAVLALLTIAAMTWSTVRYDWIDIAVRRTSGEEPTHRYEHWNAYSRVTVYGIQNYPFFWSISDSHWERTGQEGGTLRHALLLGEQITKVPDLVKAANPETYITPAAPPFFLQHGTHDATVPVQMSVGLASRLERVLAKGMVELELLEGAEHGDPRFETPGNVARVLDFLDRHLK